jgi:transcriptional regulator with XRE-family HTH domain
MTLGERVLVFRHRLRFSQSELAAATGLNKNTIARLERGEIMDVSGQHIVSLAKALQVTTDVLLGVEDETESELMPTALGLMSV